MPLSACIHDVRLWLVLLYMKCPQKSIGVALTADVRNLQQEGDYPGASQPPLHTTAAVDYTTLHSMTCCCLEMASRKHSIGKLPT